MATSTNLLEIKKEKQKLLKPLNERQKVVEEMIMNEMKQKNVTKMEEGNIEYSIEKSFRSLRTKEKIIAIKEILSKNSSVLTLGNNEYEKVAEQILKTITYKPQMDKNKLLIKYKDIK